MRILALFVAAMAMEGTLDALARNWWAILLRGLVAIGFSIAAWARPGPALAIILVMFAAYLIADGVVALVGAVRGARSDESWVLMAFEGVLGIALSAFVLARPVQAMTIAFIAIAIWALSTGVLELIEAARLRRHIPNEWLLMLSGLVRLAFGILLLARPRAGVLTLMWIAAAYALVEGVILVGLSLRLRHYAAGRQRRVGRGGATPQPA
jgi:uncharacterized membrane protein HdeD (DUF308 family)